MILIAIRSLKGFLAEREFCGWSVVKSDFDGEVESLYGKLSCIDGGLKCTDRVTERK